MLDKIFVIFTVILLAQGQSDFYRVCIPASLQNLCQSLDKDGSKVVCVSVESKIDCALKLAREEVDMGVFTEEELLLLSKQQSESHRVVASIRDQNRDDPFAFEAVAVVPANHSEGFAGLKDGNYCHAGFDSSLRWSPRVLRTLEKLTANTDRCSESETSGKSYEEVEVAKLADFFAAGCRPGTWTTNTTVDTKLKTDYSKLCSLCTSGEPSCAGYTFDMGVTVAGVDNNNRHIQALECLRRNGEKTVAFVAWQHVREFFMYRASSSISNYALLCEDGSLQTLTMENLQSQVSPCSLVKQHYSAVLATASKAATIVSELRTWWPNGLNPGSSTWQGVLYDAIIGGPAVKAVFHDDLPTTTNYTSARNLGDPDSTTNCMPSRRWCTYSSQENIKCNWVRQAAYTLGIEPAISCQQRSSIFSCLQDIRDNLADFVSLDSNYGYLARQHYRLSPVKILQNSRSNPNSFARVVALLKESTAASNVTRFENLRGTKACFPEFGGIAYVSFVNAAHDRSIISATECDYARAVGEFFDGTCAPGATHASHALNDGSDFNSTTLCTVCRSIIPTESFTCDYNYNNMFFGTNGSLACLADANTDVAFLEAQNAEAHLRTLNLSPNNFRVLCRNNTLATYTGVNVDDSCLLSLVVDGEVLARRNDDQLPSLTSLLENLDQYFGYNSATPNQLINLLIYSPFDGTSDLLFKDSAIGLAEPSLTTNNQAARNYFELFQHLESCTSGVSGLVSVFTVILAAVVASFKL